MSEFNEWFLSKFKCNDDERFDSCEDAWNAGAQSKQDEIDELRKQLKRSMISIEDGEVDRALKIIKRVLKNEQ